MEIIVAYDKYDNLCLFGAIEYAKGDPHNALYMAKTMGRELGDDYIARISFYSSSMISSPLIGNPIHIIGKIETEKTGVGVGVGWEITDLIQAREKEEANVPA